MSTPALPLKLLLPALLLSCSAQASDRFNGRVHGHFAGQPIDLLVVCESPTLGGQKGPWFYAQSDPPTHEYAEDRNGDGIALTVSYSGKDAMFMLYLDGQDHSFGNTQPQQITPTDNGFTLNMQATRYEGKGKNRQKTGEHTIHLNVDCPR